MRQIFRGGFRFKGGVEASLEIFICSSVLLLRSQVIVEPPSSFDFVETRGSFPGQRGDMGKWKATHDAASKAMTRRVNRIIIIVILTCRVLRIFRRQ
jgi:hypothetical protein